MNDFAADLKISGTVHLGESDIYEDKVDLSRLRAKVGMVFSEA